MLKIKYNSSFILFILIYFVLYIWGCKQKSYEKQINDKQIQGGTSLSRLPADFVRFYHRFAIDSAYQMQHISFPLDGATRAPGSNGDSLIPYHWRKEKWQLHREFDDFNNIFTRKFILIDKNFIIEKITGVDDLFKMERRFAKLHDGWNLIYYSVN